MLNKEEGKVLFMAVVLVTVASFIVAAMLTSIMTSGQLTEQAKSQVLSKLSAESGIDRAASAINIGLKQTPCKKANVASSYKNTAEKIDNKVTVTWLKANNSVASGCTDATKVKIVSIGTSNVTGKTFTITAIYEIKVATSPSGAEVRRLGDVLESSTS